MLSILRIVAGSIFFSAGTMKMFGYPPPPLGSPPMPPFNPMSEIGLAAILEVFGGLAIAFGLLTRPVAFLLAGEMAVAYFQVHARMAPFPITNNGMPAVLFCFIFLYLMVAGAGTWSIDALIFRRLSARR